MTIFRNKINGRLYKLYLRKPMMYTGEWYESEDIETREVRKLNYSSWKLEDFVAVASR